MTKSHFTDIFIKQVTAVKKKKEEKENKQKKSQASKN